MESDAACWGGKREGGGEGGREQRDGSRSRGEGEEGRVKGETARRIQDGHLLPRRSMQAGTRKGLRRFDLFAIVIL